MPGVFWQQYVIWKMGVGIYLLLSLGTHIFQGNCSGDLSYNTYMVTHCRERKTYILMKFIINSFQKNPKTMTRCPSQINCIILFLIMLFCTQAWGPCCREELLNPSWLSQLDAPNLAFISDNNCYSQKICFKEVLVLIPPLEILQNSLMLLVKQYFQVH